MRINFNYEMEGLFLIFPLFFIKNKEEKVILLGLGKTNIALVFGNNNEKHQQGGDVKSNDREQEYTFIYYKKTKINDTTTHYTQPYRIKVKGKTRQEAVDKCINYAMHSMKLVVVDEKDYNKDELGRISNDFNNLNQRMNELFKDTDNWYRRNGFNQANNNPYQKK